MRVIIQKVKSASVTVKEETISAIGKTADLGSDAITLDEGSTTSFEVYFPKSIQEAP